VNEQIKANLVTSFMLFVSEFGDVTKEDRKAIEAKIQERAERYKLKNWSIDTLFSCQKNADIGRRILGRDFSKAIALYFNRFVTRDGVDHESLERTLLKCDKVFQMHLEKSAIRYLKLLVKLMALIDQTPKGLLAS
jgi:hypothetical protein